VNDAGVRRVRAKGDPRLWLALLILYVVWGSTYLAIRVTVETIPPVLGAGFRFLAAGLILGAGIALVSGIGRFRVSRAEFLSSSGVSVLTLVAAFSLLFLAETRVPSGLAALLIASVPLWAVLLRLVARERVAPTTLVAVLVGFAGVAVVALPGGSVGAPVGWMLIVLAAALCEALGSLLVQRARLPADALVSTTIQMLAAGVLTIPVGLAAGEASDLRFGEISGRSIAALAFLIGPGSVLAYSAFVWLLRNASLSTATTYAYVNPVVALLLGWAILDEVVGALTILGTLLIVASVAVVIRRETSDQRDVSEPSGSPR
jgi:drug/metabolite transporter (DMT)-like permease